MDLVADGGWRMADGEWLSEELTAHIGMIMEKRLISDLPLHWWFLVRSLAGHYVTVGGCVVLQELFLLDEAQLLELVQQSGQSAIVDTGVEDYSDNDVRHAILRVLWNHRETFTWVGMKAAIVVIISIIRLCNTPNALHTMTPLDLMRDLLVLLSDTNEKLKPYFALAELERKFPQRL